MNYKISLIFLLLTSCASQQIVATPPGMKSATEKEIANCEFKGDVHGSSMLYGVFVEAALSKARQQAFNQAQSLGANTVAWQPFQTQSGATSVHGNAYRCN